MPAAIDDLKDPKVQAWYNIWKRVQATSNSSNSDSVASARVKQYMKQKGMGSGYSDREGNYHWTQNGKQVVTKREHLPSYFYETERKYNERKKDAK